MIINVPYYFSTGSTIIASQHNSNFSVIYNAFNGSIDDSNISSTAAIEYTKLALTGNIKQADLISTFNTQAGFGMVPSGGIIMWSGAIASIPAGWYLCNGSNGTPDLRNQFIVCADADVGGVAESTISGSTAKSGGSTTIAVTQIPSHKHYGWGETPGQMGSWPWGTDGTTGQLGSGSSDSDNTHGGTSSTGGGLPYVQPYFALAYIMKS